MPWCEECDRFVTPTSLGEDHECPRCGTVVEAEEAAGDVTVPWHFKLLVLATVVYLAWRAIQGIAWVATHV